jgi:GMP synthase (glutamine-hydrolysing)
VRGAHRFVLPGAQLGREHLEGRLLWDARLRAWLDEFLTLVFGDPKAGASVEEAMGIARRG